jgi:class 3 adenylate cyclase
VEQDLPDLLLLDVNMPGVSGFDVVERLKSNPVTAQVNIIMLTAMADVDSRVKGLSLGADDYLTKPFSPKELLARVNRTLKSKESSDELRRQQQRTRLTFERFVAPQIVEQLLKNPDQLRLGGETQTVTVMFADLEGFTSLSERVEPERLLQVLNIYHSLICKIILLYGGTIDKFIGDCVMALYNTPVPQEDHIARAVKTALHVQDQMYWFHQRLEPELRLSVNFGIHQGTAVIGNVGAENLMNFTAIGDTVNIAARLQGLAERGQILVTQPVFEATEEFVVGRSRGFLQVKGRSEPVHVVQISNSPIED